MYREKIIVPKGVRYIGEWKDYSLRNFNSPHILNKTITGCGYTEYCIRCNLNVIILSPRRMLLENKEDQHIGEIYYARNDIENSVEFERDVSVPRKGSSLTVTNVNPDSISSKIFELKNGVKNYIGSCIKQGIPAKVLVTYDSYRHVKEALEELGILDQFYTVVDEFQSIFIDARFKSTTEIELLNQLRDVQKLCFVSATPMLDEYLDRLEEFKNLPYYELDWITEDSTRVVKPRLEVRYTKRGLNEEINKVIQPYLDGKFEKWRYFDENGNPGEVVSREAVIYVNSVKAIQRAIINNHLTPEMCNVLCAKTKENNKIIKTAFNTVLKSIGRPVLHRSSNDYDALGSIPKRGEPHKMFTFCTRTVYLGADFYSEEARTFIFSDSNIDCLSVDISMDLEQILGRQRLDINPWKNSAYLVVRTTDHILSKEEFDTRIQEKITNTKKLLSGYDQVEIDIKHTLANNYEKVARSYNYKDDYVAVNHHAGSDLVPVFNNLMLVSEQRSFDIQQIDYKDRFAVFNALGEAGFLAESEKIGQYIEVFNSLTNFPDKIKYLHEVEINLIPEEMMKFLDQIPLKFKDYYLVFGTEKMKALNYRESDIKSLWDKLYGNTTLSDDVRDGIYSKFVVGNKYLCSEVKEMLKDIYTRVGYQSTAKATDLLNYFEVKDIKIEINGKRSRGFEILSKK